MAKKRSTTPEISQDRSTNPSNGSVTVGAGIRMSGVQYQSANFDISLTLPVKDGETPEKALERVDDIVAKVLGSKSRVRMDQLYTLICETMQSAGELKRSFDR